MTSIKWCNPPAEDTVSKRYESTFIENIADSLTHGLLILPSIYFAYKLIDESTTNCQYYVCLVYGAVLVSLFSISTFYHISKFFGNSLVIEIFHRMDRGMIYVFIAGSYTPWAYLKLFPPGAYSVHLRWVIWILAAMGIIFQQVFHEQYKRLATCFYILIGVVPALAIIEMEDKEGYHELAYGGAFYLVGVIFFKMDGHIPFAHAIWHLHVMLGVIAHYQAINTYLIPKSDFCVGHN